MICGAVLGVVVIALILAGIGEKRPLSQEWLTLEGRDRKRARVSLSDLQRSLVECCAALESMSSFLGRQRLLDRANRLRVSCETAMCCEYLTQGACDRLTAEVEVFLTDAHTAIAKQRAIPQDLNGGLYERF